MDIDANPFPEQDPVLMLRAMTMAFMLTLSKQPNLMLEFSDELFTSFPYECFKLSSVRDEKTGSITFCLVPTEDCEVL